MISKFWPSFYVPTELSLTTCPNQNYHYRRFIPLQHHSDSSLYSLQVCEVTGLIPSYVLQKNVVQINGLAQYSAPKEYSTRFLFHTLKAIDHVRNGVSQVISISYKNFFHKWP